MLDQLGQALADAIVRSSEVNGAMRKICDEGYSLYLLLDPGEGRRSSAKPRGDTGVPKALPPATERPALPPASSAPRLDAQRPSFRLNSLDVEFLKSIGIDPTRSARRRRNSTR